MPNTPETQALQGYEKYSNNISTESLNKLSEQYSKQLINLSSKETAVKQGYPEFQKYSMDWLKTFKSDSKERLKYNEYAQKLADINTHKEQAKQDFIKSIKQAAVTNLVTSLFPNNSEIINLLQESIINYIDKTEDILKNFANSNNTFASGGFEKAKNQALQKAEKELTNSLESQLTALFTNEDQSTELDNLIKQSKARYPAIIATSIKEKFFTNDLYNSTAHSNAKEEIEYSSNKIRIYQALMQSNNKEAANIIYLTSPDPKQLTEITKKIDSIPGSYMLSITERQKFIDNLFINVHKKTYNNSHNKPKDNLLIEQEENILINQIESDIDKAATTYTIPETTAPTILSDWTTNQQSNREKAIATATANFNNIPGINNISPEKQQLLRNQLCILEEKVLINKAIATQKDIHIENINQLIYETFKEQKPIKQKLEQYQSELNLIQNSTLRTKLNNQLLETLVKTHKLHISVDNNNSVHEILHKIEIAKKLSNFHPFNSCDLNEQLNYINQIREKLNAINTTTNPTKTNELKQNITEIVNKITFNQVEKAQQQLNPSTMSTKVNEAINTITSSSMYSTIKTALSNKKVLFGLGVAGLAVGAYFVPGAVPAVISGAATLGAQTISSTTTVTTTALETAGTITPMLANPATASLAGTVGVIGLAASNKTIRDIISAPFKYVAKEILDIKNKPNSYVDRLFRGGSILLPVLGTIALVTYIALIANPVTVGPAIAATLLVGATIAAGTAYGSKKISRTIAKNRYGLEEPDIYKPTKAAILAFGKDNAKAISHFFKNETIELTNKIDNLLKQNHPATKETEALEQLSTTWKSLQQGNIESWEQLSKILLALKQADYQQTINEQMHKTIDNLYTIPEILTHEKQQQTEQPANSKKLFNAINKVKNAQLFTTQLQTISNQNNTVKQQPKIKLPPKLDPGAKINESLAAILKINEIIKKPRAK